MISLKHLFKYECVKTEFLITWCWYVMFGFNVRQIGQMARILDFFTSVFSTCTFWLTKFVPLGTNLAQFVGNLTYVVCLGEDNSPPERMINSSVLSCLGGDGSKLFSPWSTSCFSLSVIFSNLQVITFYIHTLYTHLVSLKYHIINTNSLSIRPKAFKYPGSR